MQVKLSVTIITFNEEQNIERCLKSVKGVADEVIVVDSLSTDKTKEICLSYGVTFVERPFTSMIDQKNYSLSLATHRHVLSLDADESLTAELRQSVLKVKNNWTADGYKLNRLTNYRGQWIKHSGWYPDRKLRLFDRTKAHWGGQNPHDKVIPEPDAKIENLKGDMLHYYSYNVKQHLDQINRYTDISMQEMWLRGKRTSVLAILVKPPFRFFRTYFLQRGFLDGFNGFFIAGLSAYTVFLKYAKLYLAHKSGGPDEV
ncbi:glycosyltransferase involved in cell wall biosynthesis [Pontibacter aydingkolensis]|uniref:Glycosyltransferase family 2 protein n=1 Tax=Pontibacter aydingkolensis TaxID=1911536 RepID=A0ABS7CPK9_9BACT|nr:glycosyltransferase family 2 protein [Pontibacter aydingkolensis]MBW7465765.1 glycosyltransferase family 2 protein [Pontibacter aydingkolensis]